VNIAAFDELQLPNKTRAVAVNFYGDVYFTEYYHSAIGYYFSSSQETIGIYSNETSQYDVTGITAMNFDDIYLWDAMSCSVLGVFSNGSIHHVAGWVCISTQVNGVGRGAVFADNMYGQIAVGYDDNIFVPGHQEVRKVRPVTGNPSEYEVHTLCHTPVMSPLAITYDFGAELVYFAASDGGIYYISPTSHDPTLFVEGIIDSYGVPVSLAIDGSGYMFFSTKNVTALISPTGYITTLDNVPGDVNIVVSSAHELYIATKNTVSVVKG
jgi:hypothetical protein